MDEIFRYCWSFIMVFRMEVKELLMRMLVCNMNTRDHVRLNGIK